VLRKGITSGSNIKILYKVSEQNDIFVEHCMTIDISVRLKRNAKTQTLKHFDNVISVWCINIVEVLESLTTSF